MLKGECCVVAKLVQFSLPPPLTPIYECVHFGIAQVRGIYTYILIVHCFLMIHPVAVLVGHFLENRM